MKLTRIKFLVGALVALSAVISIVYATTSSATTPQDCSSNAVIKCGISSADDFKAKYNASPELQALYGHLGWSQNTINSATMVTGFAYTDGTIKVDGKTVATNAMSIGRNVDSGSGCAGTPISVAGHTYYQGTTECRFGSDGQQMLVMLDTSGQFIGAINVSCGNPTFATPVPVPVHTCDLLTAKQITRDQFQFTATATAKNGATIKSYDFDFGDGKTASATNNSVNHTYSQAGTYTAKVTTTFIVDNKSVSETSDKCMIKITVAPTPVFTCENLKTNQLSRTEFAFTTTASAQNGAQVTSYDYDFGDGETASVQSNSTTNLINHTYDQPGNYQINTTVHFTADGKNTSNDCTAKVMVLALTEACNTETHKIEKVTKGQENTPPFTTDVAQCQKIQVCDTTATPPEVISIFPSEMQSGFKDVNAVECHPKPITPPVVPQLPKTGIADGLASAIGLSSLSAATYYYLASRRS